MNEEQKSFEGAFEDVIHSINTKRLKYYSDYEIEPPSKERALSLLRSLQMNDIKMLRKVKTATPSYDFFIAPLLILFDRQAQRT
mmetsp:Transcript_21759/g.20889  ORF Transcript_21759/g.20889 Transcript_21759/m.20889 type:complete len:84 (-) Transcript_21759:454-705(-)